MCQCAHDAPQMRHVCSHIEPTLCRHFLAPLRNQTDSMWCQPQRDGKHVIDCGDLQVDGHVDSSLEPEYIVIADVTTVLAEMHRDAVRTGFAGHQRRLHRVWMGTTAGIAYRANMINVHTKADFSHDQHLASVVAFRLATMSAAMRIAATRLPGSAKPWPARFSAVP